MLPIMLKVTKRDIAEGVTDCETCPIALALSRVLAPGYTPAVGIADVVFFRKEDGFRAWSAPLPPEAQDLIARFDARKPVGPIVFPIDVPVYMRAAA
jgi:hypothetical protein